MVPTPTPLPLRRVNLYEIANRGRHESLIVVTADALESVRRRLRESFPAEIAHWDRRDELLFELLASRLAPAAADTFLTAFFTNPAMRGWRLIAWRT